ncbi:MAG: hypothetical protein AAFR21_14875 [Pseudomonadota bacterium]
MGVTVIACYRPKPGQSARLKDLVATHLEILRAEDLVAEGPSMVAEAKDGTILEIFTWKSQEAIDAAHTNPRVGAMWEDFGAACDYVPVGSLEEASQLFSPFTPVVLDGRAI